MRRCGCQQVCAGKRTLHRFCAPVNRGFLGGRPTVSMERPWLHVEPEANPLSRPLVPFGRCRKELGPQAETSSSQSPLSFVSAQGRRKLHPLPCSSSPRVATSSISFASASGESSSTPLRLLSPQKPCFCGGPNYPLTLGFGGGPECPPVREPAIHRACRNSPAKRTRQQSVPGVWGWNPQTRLARRDEKTPAGRAKTPALRKITYTSICSIWKASMTSPSLMS